VCHYGGVVGYFDVVVNTPRKLHSAGPTNRDYPTANEYWNVQQRLHDSFWYSANGELLPQNPLDPMPLRFFFGNSLRPELTIGASLR